ncbi:MAG: hypothetical protein JWQ71_4761 [Pedosphaera sp.]|nr:hypothetical protein [Pedosphaera sp.]
MKLKILMLYGSGFAVTFLFAAFLWHWQMPGGYFICADNGLILDFLPPFVHAGTKGDFFIKPQRTVYIIWMVYLTTSLLLPALCTWMFVRLYQRDLRRAWM